MPPALQNPITLWLLLTAALAGLVYAFMRPELRWKAIGYGAFLLACAVAIWPPYEWPATTVGPFWRASTWRSRATLSASAVNGNWGALTL